MRMSQRRLTTAVKRAVQDEWVGVNQENNQALKQIRMAQNEQVVQRQKVVQRTIQRMNQLKEYKQDLSLQSNFARQVHKNMILDKLQKSKNIQVLPQMSTPMVLK